jgi:hypothetical protein
MDDKSEPSDFILPEDIRQARDELIAEGLLVVVEEIDPRTGKLRNRYFHKKFAPKPN